MSPWITAPTSRVSNAFWAFSTSRVKSLACRPKRESLTIASASPKSRYARTAATGANAYLLFGEPLTTVQFAGSTMILVGMVFLRVYEGWVESRTRSPWERGVEAAAD